MTRERLKNIIDIMLRGRGEMYFGQSPRISRAECRELKEMGLRLQCEHPIHEPPFVFPLKRKEFETRAEQIMGKGRK